MMNDECVKGKQEVRCKEYKRGGAGLAKDAYFSVSTVLSLNKGIVDK
jgi:hypothetical protein